MTAPDPSARATAQGRTLIEAGQPTRALEALTSALAADPDNGTAWCLVAQCHLALNDPARAIHAARRAVALMPTAEWPHRLLSIGLMGSRAFTEAHVEAVRAVECAPNLWRTHAQVARVDCASGRIVAESWWAARRAVELGPGEAEAHFVLGLVALSAKEDAIGQAAFLECLRLDPNNATARNNLAVVEMRRKRVFSAIPHLMAALRENPNLETSARNLRIVLRYVCFVMAPMGYLAGTIARETKRVGVSGSADHVRTPGLVIANVLLVVLWCGAALLLRQRIGRRFRSILAASVRSDNGLAVVLLLNVAEVSFGVAALAIGFPVALTLEGLSVACAGAVIVTGVILRVRASRQRRHLTIDFRQRP